MRLALLLLLFPAFLPACSDRYQASEKPAVDALHAGDLEGALLALEEAVSAGAPPAGLVRLTGRYTGLVALPEGDTLWMSDLRAAVDLLEEGTQDSALSLLFRVIADAPEQPEGHFYYGLAALASSDEAAAADEAFERAVQARPSCWPCLLGRAIALERLGRLEEAGRELDRAAETAAEQPVLRYYLARRALQRGDRAAARAQLQALIQAWS